MRNQPRHDCRQQFENFELTAAVQVRQRVSHKRTFFYLEQAILKPAGGAEDRTGPRRSDFFFRRAQ